MLKNLVIGVLVAGVSLTVHAQSDFQWTFGSIGNDDYTIDTASPGLVFTGGLGSPDPTITLIEGMTYEVTGIDSIAHPFQVLAKGATAAQDVILLAQGSVEGLLESDPGIDWDDDGLGIIYKNGKGITGTVRFTVTTGLIAAMTQGGLSPGYRCRFHSSMMRGDFVVQTGSVVDYQVTFDADGIADYRINSQGDVSSEIYSGSFPADDQTLNLQVGKRYAVTVIDTDFHPFQVLAKGATQSSDVVLLAQGATAGSLESDAGIGWTDDGLIDNGTVEFTMTQPLLEAMFQNGNAPGYRCELHPDMMRGDFNVTGGASPQATITGSSTFVEAGNALSLNAQVTGTVGAVTFQWLKDNNPISDGGTVSGATTNSISFNPVQESDSGDYVLEFTDAAKATTMSAAFTLTVLPAGSLPVTGLLGLSALACAVVLGTVMALRRRRT